jgi:protocatechuate 3,4-dioxygenase beta subunit
MRKLLLLIVVMGLAAYDGAAMSAQVVQGQPQGGRGAQQQRPARDRAAVPQGTASISGRVLTADTGRPLKRARVMVSGGGRGGRSTTTDDQGRYAVTTLSAGSYTITASKAGFVDASYGQRRPLQPGTPLQVADGQQAANIDLRLVRGGVITGHVVDEDGEPLLRALVTVQRYRYVNGERQLAPAGADQTDDRGQYRVFGLPPGDYYVSATLSGIGGAIARGLQQLVTQPAGGRGGRGAFAIFGGNDDPEPSGYAPTYYPGVTSASEAGKVSVAPGQEVAGIDFQAQLVPFATIRGIVTGSDDGAGVMLAPQDSNGGLLGSDILRGRSETGGAFTISNVPPGRYLAIARSGGRWDEQKIAVQPVVVNGQNISNLVLVLVPGVSLSGNITVESSGTPAPTDYSVFRIDVPDADPLPLGGGPFGGGRGGNRGGGRAAKNGSFEIDNVMPGRHYLRVSGQGAWTLKSVSVGGRDVTDQPFELKTGQDVGNITVVMTDRSTELAGTVRDAAGNTGGGLTVIAFSTDPQYWRPQSREIQVSRTDQNGAYRLRNLPPGDYQIAVVDDVEQGEWYDPSYLQELLRSARPVTLDEGDRKTLDLASR